MRGYASAAHALSLAAMLVAIATMAGCAHRGSPPPDLQPWNDASQAVIVVTPDWDTSHGALHRFERSGGSWREIGKPQAVMVGRTGAAWGLGLHPAQPSGPAKREGDGRSPAGVFRIAEAFGYADKGDTALPYAAMSATHYCMDVSDSPLYNRIVDARIVGNEAVAGSTEPMRLDLHARGDQRYRLGFVIEHNPLAVRDGGSCIFAHLWKAPGEATAGCTSMDDSTMRGLLQWLRPERHPVFVLMPVAEYRELHAGWRLPPLDTQP